MKKFNSLLLLLFVLVGCKSEQKTTRTIASASELCGRYRWDESKLPLKLTLDREFNDEFKNAPNSSNTFIQDSITTTLQEWEIAIGRGSGKIFSPNINLLESSPEHNNISLYRYDKNIDDSSTDALGIYGSRTWFNDQSSQALAVTYYSVMNTNGNYTLTNADIIFNLRDHEFGFGNGDDVPEVYLPGSSKVRQYDFRTVLLHELGHFIGYCHVDERSYLSVMNPYYDGPKRKLVNRDITYIRDLYKLGSSLSVKSKTAKKEEAKDNEEIHFVVELLATGECNHYREGEKFYSHQVDLNKKHH